MDSAINKLDLTVLDQELELVTHTLQGLLDEMREHAGTQFHIHPTNGVAPSWRTPRPSTCIPEYLKHIGYQTVPAIAAVMAKSADDATEDRQADDLGAEVATSATCRPDRATATRRSWTSSTR